MYVHDFIWLPDVVEKLEVKHQVTTDEVEEVFFNQPRFRFVQKGRVQGVPTRGAHPVARKCDIGPPDPPILGGTAALP